MKTKISILVFAYSLFLLSTSSNAQGTWEQQNPIPTAENLNDVFSLSETMTITVGNTGAIFKTINSGNSWTRLNSGTSYNLQSVWFVDGNTGWIAGNNGLILKTINGGSTWSVQTSGTPEILYSIIFINASTGWAVGWNGTILKTTNGGTNWTLQTLGTAAFYGVHFIDSNTGWMVGQYQRIYKTINGGTNWSLVSSGSEVLHDVFFVNSSIGWAVGSNGLILETGDGGSTWYSQTSHTINPLYSVMFYNSNYGWAAGAAGTILQTSNGGVTWNTQTTSTTASINGVWSNGLLGDAIGEAGTILHTYNGGTTWTSQTSGSINNLNSICFTTGSDIESNIGWAVGNLGTILKTMNGGTSWVTQTSGTSVSLRGVTSPGTNLAWAAGDGGTILKTTDGGTTWNPQTSGTTRNLTSVLFISTSVGWVVGSSGIILKTTDGGANWNPQTSGTPTVSLNKVYFGFSNGWAVGSGGTVLKTTDGGTNWTLTSNGASNILYSVYFNGALTGWTVGYTGSAPVLLKTIDGGANWTPVNSGTTGPLYDVFFASSNTGYIVGGQGKILKTNDGGVSWTLQTSTSSNYLRSIWFRDWNKGWISGDGGTILHYTDYSPYSQTTNLTVTYSNYQNINVSWTRGNGNQCALFVKQTSSGTCTPDVNVTYLPNATFGLGDQIGSSSWYCVYNGTGTSASINGLQANTSYRFQVCEYNFSPDFTHYNISTATNNPLTATTAIAPPLITVNPGDKTLCEPLSTTFSVTASGSGLSYQWQVDAGSGYLNVTNGGVYSGCTTSTLSLTGIPASLTANKYHCVVTNTSGSATSGGALLTVNPLPVNPVNISGDQIVCLNSNYPYTVPIIDYATSYTWTYPTGFSGSSSSNTINLATGSNAIPGNITVKGVNACGSGPVRNFVVSVKNLPGDASQITGLNSICTGSINIGYNTATITDADYYVWSLPFEATGSSTINSIMVNYGSNPLTGQITVKGHNMCGDGVQSVLPVSVNTVSAAIGTISGSSNVCKNQNDVLYSINAIPNATSYAWTLPPGITGSNSTNSVLLSIGPDAFSGDLKVSGVNSCGIGAEIVFPVIVDEVPDALGPVSGPTIVCRGQANVQYSVPNSDRATSYVWDLPDGSSETTITNKIVLNFDNNALSGSLYVTPYNTCGAGNSSSLNIEVSVPPTPTISALGATEFCSGGNVQLSIAPINNVSYKWLRDGGTIGDNTSIYSATEAGNYTITITNSSGCYSTSLNSIGVIVNPVPQVSAVNISGLTSFCQGGNVELSVTNNPDYTYQWENNGIGISGALTSTYVAQNSGTYLLKITNSSGCFTKTENVPVNTLTTPAAPLVSASGSLVFCQGDSVNLSVTNTAGYTYQWKLNGGAVGINSNQFTAKSEGTYNILVANSNGCSASSSNSVNVVVNSLPAASAVSLSGPTQFCEGGSITLSIPSTSDYFYNWRNENGLISGANTNNYIANTSGKYQLDISNSSGCIVSTLTVNVVVKTMPYKPLIISDNYQPGICLGENPIRLNVSQTVSAYNYQWYKNGIPLSDTTSSYLEGFLSPGDYSLVADIEGCKSESDIFNVSFADAPEKPFVYAQGPTVWYLACSNVNASQYKWYFNGNLIPGADKYLYVANQNLGNYFVSIGNAKGCFTASDVIKIPTGATGIEDIDPFEGLKIYPNPTPGIFTVEMDNPVFGDLIISILDQGGKEILNIEFEKTTEHFSSQIDLSGQSKGMYLINLLIDKYLENRKIIVE